MIQRLPRRPLAGGQSPKSTLAPVISISAAHRIGGIRWRREHGLLGIRDLVRDYAERRYLRTGALHPLPEDLLPQWRELRS